MASSKGSLGPHFSSHTERTQQAHQVMQRALAAAASNEGDDDCPSLAAPIYVLDKLTASLLDDANPTSSAAAEVAYLLCAYCLVEERILKLIPPSPDLNSSDRLDGDRTASERLSTYLREYNIPATQGALQSSTFRGGYGAAQAKDDSLAVFLTWLHEPGRRLPEVQALFVALARTFARLRFSFPSLPPLAHGAFTFAATRRLIDRLLEVPSAGAYQQYLVAALTAQEYSITHPSWRIVTKGVGSPDSARRSAGDI